MVIAKITICSALARPRRCNPASAMRQILPANPPTLRPPDNNNRATKKPSAITITRPATTAAVTVALPLYHHMRATIAAPPSRKSLGFCASSTCISARSTSSGGAWPSRLSGGHAKHAKQTADVATPIKKGWPPAAPGVIGSKEPSTTMNASCINQPMAQPTTVVTAPKQNKLAPYS